MTRLKHRIYRDILCLLEEEYNYSPDSLTAERLQDLSEELEDKISDPAPEDEDTAEELCGDMDQFQDDTYD